MDKWNTTKLIAIAGLAVTLLILGLIGNAISVLTGIPFAGIPNMIIFPMFILLCCLLIRKFGAATLMGFIYGFLALPLPSLGPPGFFPKILLATSLGLIIDIIFSFFKNPERKLNVIIIGIIATYPVGFTILGFGLLFKVPGFEKFVALVPIFAIIALPFGIIAGYLAYLIYNKLKNTTIVKRIQV